MLDGLKVGNEALKKANEMFSIEEIEQIMDDTAEAIEKQKEIDALLSGQLSQEDEDDVLKELDDLLASEENLEDLPEVPSTGNFYFCFKFLRYLPIILFLLQNLLRLLERKNQPNRNNPKLHWRLRDRIFFMNLISINDERIWNDLDLSCETFQFTFADFFQFYLSKKCFMEYMKNANEMMVYDFSYLLLVSLDL